MFKCVICVYVFSDLCRINFPLILWGLQVCLVSEFAFMPEGLVECVASWSECVPLRPECVCACAIGTRIFFMVIVWCLKSPWTFGAYVYGTWMINSGFLELLWVSGLCVCDGVHVPRTSIYVWSRPCCSMQEMISIWEKTRLVYFHMTSLKWSAALNMYLEPRTEVGVYQGYSWKWQTQMLSIFALFWTTYVRQLPYQDFVWRIIAETRQVWCIMCVHVFFAHLI